VHAGRQDNNPDLEQGREASPIEIMTEVLEAQLGCGSFSNITRARQLEIAREDKRYRRLMWEIKCLLRQEQRAMRQAQNPRVRKLEQLRSGISSAGNNERKKERVTKQFIRFFNRLPGEDRERLLVLSGRVPSGLDNGGEPGEDEPTRFYMLCQQTQPPGRSGLGCQLRVDGIDSVHEIPGTLYLSYKELEPSDLEAICNASSLSWEAREEWGKKRSSLAKKVSELGEKLGDEAEDSRFSSSYAQSSYKNLTHSAEIKDLVKKQLEKAMLATVQDLERRSPDSRKLAILIGLLDKFQKEGDLVLQQTGIKVPAWMGFIRVAAMHRRCRTPASTKSRNLFLKELWKHKTAKLLFKHNDAPNFDQLCGWRNDSGQRIKSARKEDLYAYYSSIFSETRSEKISAALDRIKRVIGGHLTPEEKALLEALKRSGLERNGAFQSYAIATEFQRLFHRVKKRASLRYDYNPHSYFTLCVEAVATNLSDGNKERAYSMMFHGGKINEQDYKSSMGGVVCLGEMSAKLDLINCLELGLASGSLDLSRDEQVRIGKIDKRYRRLIWDIKKLSRQIKRVAEPVRKEVVRRSAGLDKLLSTDADNNKKIDGEHKLKEYYQKIQSNYRVREDIDALHAHTEYGLEFSGFLEDPMPGPGLGETAQNKELSEKSTVDIYSEKVGRLDFATPEQKKKRSSIRRRIESLESQLDGEADDREIFMKNIGLDYRDLKDVEDVKRIVRGQLISAMEAVIQDLQRRAPGSRKLLMLQGLLDRFLMESDLKLEQTGIKVPAWMDFIRVAAMHRRCRTPASTKSRNLFLKELWKHKTASLFFKHEDAPNFDQLCGWRNQRGQRVMSTKKEPLCQYHNSLFTAKRSEENACVEKARQLVQREEIKSVHPYWSKSKLTGLLVGFDIYFKSPETRNTYLEHIKRSASEDAVIMGGETLDTLDVHMIRVKPSVIDRLAVDVRQSVVIGVSDDGTSRPPSWEHGQGAGEESQFAPL
jgi:hypothetical protein